MKKFLCLLLTICMVLSTAVAALADAADGTYEVESAGNAPGMKISVTFEGGKIAGVAVVSHNETPGICDAAIERIPAAIVENNSVNVDAVTGATNTSNGIINGVIAAIELAGGSAADYQGKAEAAAAELAEVEMDCDIVVAGAGIAGLTAAVTAAEKGASVILLEKTAQVGGSLALAGGNFVSVNSEVGKSYGIDDNKEATLAYWKWCADQSVNKDTGFPDMERVEFLLDRTDMILTWMKEHQVPYYRATDVGEQTVAKIYTEGRGAAVAATLEQRAIEAGVKILYETPAVEIIMQDGAAVGIRAQSATEDITIKAAKAVMLCTGGFGSNPEMLAELVPGYAGARSSVAAGNTGDGFKMAEAVGAALYPDAWVMPSGLTLDPDVSANVADTSMFSYSALANRALVNEAGKRFTNEYIGNAYAVLTNAVAAEKCDVYYIIDGAVDEAALASLEEGAEKGVIAKADTIEALAEAIGMDAAALKGTIDAYNGYCAAGADAEFEKKADYLTAYAEEGPYYAVKFIPALLGTIYGVVTDYDGHVFDTEGNIIPGLYAAGEMSNRSFYNQVYVGAASLSLYPISSQLAIDAILGE